MHTADIREKGRGANGETIYSSRRLFMQILAFKGAPDPSPFRDALSASSIQGNLYLDLNHPNGLILVTAHEDPTFFLSDLRSFLAQPPFSSISLRPEFTMFGRTYAIGYESDLDQVLIDRPFKRLCDPAQPWAIWYPLRRKGSFEALDDESKKEIMSEHGSIGAQFSKAGHGQDIRLACHGLDANDNDFVIGLIGPELAPLSLMVQAMRKTQQTASYLEKLGPFLIGQSIWRRGLGQSGHVSE